MYDGGINLILNMRMAALYNYAKPDAFDYGLLDCDDVPDRQWIKNEL
jgi:hypothetical protein